MHWSVFSWSFKGGPEQISRAFFVLLSIFWYSALQTLVTVAYLAAHSISSTYGDHRALPRLPFLLPSGSSFQAPTWGNHRAHLVCSCSFRGSSPLLPDVQCLKTLLYKLDQTFGCLSPLDKHIPCYSILAKIAVSYFKHLKQYLDPTAKFLDLWSGDVSLRRCHLKWKKKKSQRIELVVWRVTRRAF